MILELTISVNINHPRTNLGSKPSHLITYFLSLSPQVLKNPRPLLWVYASIPAQYLLRNLQRPPTTSFSLDSFPHSNPSYMSV